jgi:shikimate dehydrogenase
VRPPDKTSDTFPRGAGAAGPPRGPSVLIGLVGDGIQRSYTPQLHEREADRQGIRLVYTTIDSGELGLTVDDLPDVLRWARTLGYRGLNVTHPFKQEIVRHLDDLVGGARVLGAVNTVVFDNDATRGYNTDASGFERSFGREFSTAPRDRVVQIGAGGAGSAVAHALLTLGVRRLTVVDIESDRATRLVGVLATEFGADRVVMCAVEKLSTVLATADGVVNTTPVGMDGHPGSPVAAADLRKDLWLADIVYRPAETALVRAAQAVGAQTLSGVGMSVFQAVAAFEVFTGRAADAEAMLAHSDELLRSGL